MLKVFFAPPFKWAICKRGRKPRRVRLQRIECPSTPVSDGPRGWLVCRGELTRTRKGWVIR